MPLFPIRNFLKLESAGGIILFVAAILALIISNSPLLAFYESFFKTPIEIQIGSYDFTLPLLFWINDGLMTIFFLLVTIELKREFLEGELSGVAKIILPGVAALGGMLVPGIIYAAINYHHPLALKGWAVPVATDIAFALGVLSLFGKRVPLGLKVFLMALAIFDDMGAIVIIAAVFHTTAISYWSLFFSAAIWGLLFLLNRWGVRRLVPYMLLGIVLWVCVLKSGLHATVAGVLLGMAIPSYRQEKEKYSPLRYLEKALHPWVAYAVMPLFAFANAGVSMHGISPQILTADVTLGIVLGLVLGKQLGVFGFSWLIIKLGWAKLPEHVTWKGFYGVALLCGIGFTMSLFLGTLAFEQDDPMYLIQVRIGVLLGSALSGIIGAMVLYRALQNKGGRKFEAK